MDRYTQINLSKSSKEHLYIQLANGIENMIICGDFEGNDKLPSIRKLSELLDINRITVVNAYKYLEEKGRVYKKSGSGTYIIPLEGDTYYEDEVSAADTEVYDFFSTSPSANLFPVIAFKNAINYVLDTEGGLAFGYQESKGYRELRESITEYLLNWNINVSADRIQILSGAQQGIDIVAKTILEYGDSVILESPTYAGAIATFKSKAVNIIDIDMTRDGIDFERLEELVIKFKPKLFYTMPNFQNPTGYTYTDSEKRKILELSDKYNFYILEDDYATELNYCSESIYSIKSMDVRDKVIYIKSFSKIFMPGLRLGFMITPEKISNEIVLAKHTTDISTSGLTQRAFCKYFKTGDWKHQISKIRLIMGNRMALALECLEQYMPNSVKYYSPKGGVNIWIELPDGIEAKKLMFLARQKSVMLASGEVFYVSANNKNMFRLSISAIKKDMIRQGIIILSQVIEELLQEQSYTEYTL